LVQAAILWSALTCSLLQIVNAASSAKVRWGNDNMAKVATIGIADRTK
jgi:hypothetical protein